MPIKRKTQRRQHSRRDKELKINSALRAPGQRRDIFRNKATESLRRVQANQALKNRNSLETSKIRWQDANPSTPIQKIGIEAFEKDLREREKHQAAMNELPPEADLDKSYIPHYRNSFPQFPPLPSEKSKRSLLLREPPTYIAEKLNPEAVLLEECATEWLTHGPVLDGMGLMLLDKDEHTLKSTEEDMRKEKHVRSPPKAPRPAHRPLANTKFKVLLSNQRSSKSSKSSYSFISARWDEDEDDEMNFKPLRITRPSPMDGSYNYSRSDNNFSSIREQSKYLEEADYPEPDFDDMNIPPGQNRYHCAISDRPIMQTPTEFWRQRDDDYEVAKETERELMLRKKVAHEERHKRALVKEFHAARGGTQYILASRGEKLMTGQKEKNTRRSGEWSGMRYGNGHGHEHGQFSAMSRGTLSSPKRKRELSQEL